MYEYARLDFKFFNTNQVLEGAWRTQNEYRGTASACPNEEPPPQRDSVPCGETLFPPRTPKAFICYKYNLVKTRQQIVSSSNSVPAQSNVRPSSVAVNGVPDRPNRYPTWAGSLSSTPSSTTARPPQSAWPGIDVPQWSEVTRTTTWIQTVRQGIYWLSGMLGKGW